MIEVTPQIALEDSEIELQFVRASGPGGQHVNKVATAVQLRFDLAGSRSLPEPVRVRAMRLAGRRLTSEGSIVIEASRFRSQERNRRDAIERLVALLRQAATPPRPRKKTAPPPGSRRRRLETKRKRAGLKQLRRPLGPSDDG